jgi:glyoxylase-like metal-dependent hydrolase (beta-lactamase superfamily II)
MRKTILIALGVLVLLPVAGIAVLFATREPPDGPRVEVDREVVGVEAGGSYAWIVRTPHGAVLVDAGLDASGAAILAELKSAGVQPQQVLAVLITHGHPDHYAAATLFPKAEVLGGADDIPMMHGDGRHYSTFGRVMSALMPLPKGPDAVTPLRGGEQLEFDGARFAVIATPGHSPGSVVYLYKDVLFTGDSLMRKGDGVTIAPSLFSEDSAENRRSLIRLERLSFDKIADGHAGVTLNARVKLARLLAGT